MSTQEHLEKIKTKCQQLLAIANTALLSRHQPCGCIVCICENEQQCQGCGAKTCGTHPVGAIPNPVYDTPLTSPAIAGWRATIAAITCLRDMEESPLIGGVERKVAKAALLNIIAAWPEELLK